MNFPLEPFKMASDNNPADMFASLLNEMGSSINHTTDIMDYISLDFSDKSLQQLMALFGDNFSSSAQPSLEMLEREQLFITILYGSAIAVALMGNLAVLLAFFFGRRRDSDLSVFLANLAFSDIILSVFCMPFTMSQVVKHHWPFSDALCPIVMFLQLSSVISSVYTLVAVGVDRYFFVTRPLKARLTKRKAKLVIGCIWALAYGLSSIQV
jgi:7 transmembrane receptor (rhodopsin family)